MPHDVERRARSVWPYRLDGDVDVTALRRRVTAVAGRSQYGWGQTIDFGPFVQAGFLGDKWLGIVGHLDRWGWLPRDLAGRTVADVGCFTGGIALVVAARGAQRVIAVDEVDEHLDQCRLLVELFGTDAVETVTSSLYGLGDRVEPGSLDLIVLGGVLYHLSDMLVGLVAMQQLLAPGGVLLVQTNAVESFEHSYANFGRFYAGWWWQPTALCLQDMCEFAGLERPEVRFYEPGRCLARAAKPADGPSGGVPFKRGMHWPFDDLRDSSDRQLDVAALAPAPDPAAETALARRWAVRLSAGALRGSFALAARVREGARRRRQR